jgi:predicted RNA-binding protein Jag
MRPSPFPRSTRRPSRSQQSVTTSVSWSGLGTDRILVDVGGYREKRNAALRRFAEGIADEVKSSGDERALEPMSPADRKVIHDTVNEIDGVETRSDGMEPTRYVVIAPV